MDITKNQPNPCYISSDLLVLRLAAQSESLNADNAMEVPDVYLDNSSFNIGMVLDEKNYDLWAPLIQIYIAGRKKMGYLLGFIKAPVEDDPKYDDWFYEDKRIKSWLLSAMKLEIMKRYIQLSTSKEIWDALKTAYFDENDEARIYSLNQKT
ncbi:uncharacterized protein [Pyrus communis]|uniref:uncharacterized protein n=1 Tax=Pyrus communis TaxID=23211 RepID=UPI0035BFE86C